MSEIIIYVIDAFTKRNITRFWIEESYILPNVNDTICLTSIGDFVVASSEFDYRYDSDYCYTKLDDITLYVYEKPKDEE